MGVPEQRKYPLCRLTSSNLNAIDAARCKTYISFNGIECANEET